MATLGTPRPMPINQQEKKGDVDLMNVIDPDFQDFYTIGEEKFN